MKYGDLVRVVDLRDGSFRDGIVSGMGDWGIRFAIPGSSFRSFTIHDYVDHFYSFEDVPS